jgi:hypothetical protein
LSRSRELLAPSLLGAAAVVAIVTLVTAAASAPGAATRWPRSTDAPLILGSSPSASRATLTATGGLPYTPDGPFNSPIPKSAAFDPHSAAIVAGLVSGPVANLYEYGTPVYTVNQLIPTVQVRCTADFGPCELANTHVPIPVGAQPSKGTDASMSIVDLRTRTVFDFWQAKRYPDGSWTTSWGTKSALDGSGLDPIGSTAAGFSVLAGLIRTFEIERGSIEHALVFSSEMACNGPGRYPATHSDGLSNDPHCIPEGARVQLDPTIDVRAIPGITRGEIAVARALQVYGAYCRDRGGASMAINFQDPVNVRNPYPAAGFSADYDNMPHIPWHRLRVLRSWDGS